MNNPLAACVRFLPDLRPEWPSTEIIAEVRHPTPTSPPWSLRLQLWAPPNKDGIAMAWAFFLVPDAPIEALSTQSSFPVTLGGRQIGSCTLVTMPYSLVADSVALQARCDQYQSAVTILLECNHGDEAACGCRERATSLLARLSREPAIRTTPAPAPDAERCGPDTKPWTFCPHSPPCMITHEAGR